MKELALDNTRLDGRYDIQSLLGRGSYAEIYLARDILASPQSPHNTVVIKALNVFLQNDLDPDLERTLVENFQNEAIALDRVRHPNIISRLGHGTARDLRGTVFHYLVLEYLPGGDLARICRQKSLSLAQALDYIEQICAGLGHAHERGVIHRDVKPQNLLLTGDGKTVKIADFGVARVSESDAPITRVGTNIYAPPEHSPMMAGATGTLTFTKLTPAADIYSLAKSAYVLITCESPRFFAGQPITELPFAMRQEVWAEKLIEILNRATRNNPLERYQNVNEFWEDLAQLKLLDEDLEPQEKVTENLNKTPQAHISKGYTPLAPQRPEFNTSRDLKLKLNQSAVKEPSTVLRMDFDILSRGTIEQPPEEQSPIIENNANQKIIPPPQKRSFTSGMSIFLISLALFAGSLYATYNYLRGQGFLPSFQNSRVAQTGTANTDVNLRPSPSSNNEPIGLVTKNSRVKIVNRQNNWYEVEIMQHGRPREDSSGVNRGWVYGKYIDVVE